MNLKVIAFDVFGTVFNLSGVPRQEIGDYVRHVHAAEWFPLFLPESWLYLPAHADSAEGIARLRTKYTVVTLSNGPLYLLSALSRLRGITWDAIIPIELAHVYKPNPAAYRVAIDLLRVRPDEVLMVTANKNFGDLEAAAQLGMQSKLIRDESSPTKTIVQLAEELGC